MAGIKVLLTSECTGAEVECLTSYMTDQLGLAEGRDFHIERAASANPAADIIACVDCGSTFSFSEGERKFFETQGFQPPKRCKECRTKKKASKSNVRTYSRYSAL